MAEEWRRPIGRAITVEYTVAGVAASSYTENGQLTERQSSIGDKEVPKLRSFVEVPATC